MFCIKIGHQIWLKKRDQNIYLYKKKVTNNNNNNKKERIVFKWRYI